MTYNDIRANVIGLGGNWSPSGTNNDWALFYPNNKNQLDC